MSDKKTNIHLVDPLSEVTRRERKYLLGFSLLGIAIAQIGIIPTRINALGVEFASADQDAFLYILISAIMYFCSAFAIYSWSDFVVWRSDILAFYASNIRNYYDNIESHIHGDGYPVEKDLEAAYKRARFWTNLAWPTSTIRALFEFLLPVLVAMYAMFRLYSVARDGT